LAKKDRVWIQEDTVTTNPHLNNDAKDVDLGRVEDDDLQGMMVWIQEDTERDYDLIEYGKNTLVVGDGCDGKFFGRC
jgi:hypothetical protein